MPKLRQTVIIVHTIAVKKTLIALPGLLLLTAASSMAMSLGRHSGATLIGRPLDVSVQAVLDSQDDVGSLCLEAEVFYADTRVPKSRVRVTLEKSSPAQPLTLIRIRSSVLVDEPVVTFYLRAGCQLKTERRYVTLAELAPEVVQDKNTSASILPAVPNSPGVVPPQNTAASTEQSTTPKIAKSTVRSRSRTLGSEMQTAPANATPGDVASVPLAKEQGQTPSTKPQRAPVITQDSKAAKPGKARLKLEPLDTATERQHQLKSSAELLSIPAADPQERAAASALWRALSAQPQDILRDTEKLQALEKSVRGLQAQSQKTLLSIDDMNVKLQKAQEGRYPNTLIYGLVALLLAALAGLIYLLRHRSFRHRGESGDKPWWRRNEASENHQETSVNNLQPRQKYEPAANRLDSVLKPPSVDVQVDFDPSQPMSGSGGARSAANPSFVDSATFAPKDKSDFGYSIMQPTRAVKAEELVDVQQQADFFVSIGQHDQAIEVLRSYIDENHETSPLIYLDLFNLYHQLQKPAEYDSLRVTFNERFNTQVPTFELYTDKNIGLESYPLALSRIESLWPSSKVLEIIEESLFRRPGVKTEAFNLEAYRELLLLYSVATEIIKPEPRAVAAVKPKFDLPESPADNPDSGRMPFEATAVQPLLASMKSNQRASQYMPAEPSTDSLMPTASRSLDIDLSKLTAPVHKAETDSKSDAGGFSRFDTDLPAGLPVADSVHLASVKGAADVGNLIDFDAFDVPQVTPAKPKLPGV